MFMLQIQVATFDDLERIVACLKHSADPSVVAQVQVQASLLKFSDAAVVEALAEQIPAASEVLETSGALTGNTAQQEPKKRGRPRREVAAVPESAAPTTDMAEPQGESTVQDATESAQQTYTLADIRSALQDVVAKTPGDMRPATGLLAEFNAARVSEIKAEDYGRFIAKCKAA